jgi:ABC-2 type transport system permease protein
MKSLLRMTWMEAKLFLREPVNAFFTLVFPLMYLFLYGSIFSNMAVPQSGGQGTVDSFMGTIASYVPALTAMIIGTTGLMATTITMASYRENGILRRLRTTPVSPLVVLAAQVTVVFVMISVGMLLLIIVGKLVYHVSFEGNTFSILGGFVLSCLSFLGIGFILAGSLPTTRSAQTVAMLLLYPNLLLSGAFFPLNILPAAVQKVSHFLPLTYVVNLLRGLWIGEAWSLHVTDAVVLAALLVAGVLVSVKTFRWE